MNYFAYPRMLFWSVVPIACIFAGLLLMRHRRKTLRLLGKESTVRRLLPAGLPRRQRSIAACRALALLCFVIALAGPLLGSKLVEYKQKGLDVFIAVDCSSSMLAEDFKPNRMEHAKLVLSELINHLVGSRIGVIAFAGEAYTLCPLTADSGAAAQILDSIDTGAVPLPGTAISKAIRQALQGLKAGEGTGRVLVLLTDGEDHHSDPMNAAEEAKKTGLRIYTVGIGSPQGEPIPVFDESGNRTGYKRDKKGEVVISRTDEKTLSDIAQATKGEYFRAATTGAEADQLIHALEGLEHGDHKAQLFNRLENRYQWPLALGILFLLVSMGIPERRWGE